ncbi:MOSC domain-containing protein [Rheinheimera sp. WS51]|uniref:MOSC domain-containing protein n=1 Tax=Rheinheimera sp. WS51 TaxID=3425886 RepID=UPI003D91E279
MTTFYLNGVYRGKPENRYGIHTAINKQAVEQAVYLTKHGLTDDASADTKHHGGLERALHQYPLEHYAYWLSKYPSIAWQPPGMGENISSTGMTEHNVYIGDRYQWGDAIIEVSQPRSPCYKLNKRWDNDNISVDMQQSGYCGWLYRIIQPGQVSINEPLILQQRLAQALSVAETCRLFFTDPLNKQHLASLRQQTKLSASWLSKVEQRIATNKVENWQFRLHGVDNTLS